MSNFQVHWFSSFWYTWSFMFHHFGLKLLFLGAKFDFFGVGVNRGQMLKLNTVNPERHILAWFRVFWAIKASKSVKRFDRCACLRKKIKLQESDISPICLEDPRERIFTKLRKNVPLVDLINCDKFCDNLFKGLNFTGGQISKFSHRNLTSPL